MAKRVNYTVYKNFVLRVPGLPLNAVNKIPVKRYDIDSFIRKQWSNPLLRNAILLASSDLSKAIINCIDNHVPFSSGIIDSFLKYFTRFSTRATPFGLFAGVVSGAISKEKKTEINLLPVKKGKLSCRLDMEYLTGQIYELSKNNEFRERLIFSPSSSLYPLGNQWRYISSKRTDTGSNNYSIESIENHPLLLPFMEFCEDGRKYNEMISFFTNKDYAELEARQFVGELIDIQLLTSNLEPVLTGEEYGHYLLRNLSKDRATSYQSKYLVEQIEQLNGLIDPLDYEEKNRAVHCLAKKNNIQFNANKLIQGDLLRNAKSSTLSEQISNKIILGLRIMKALSNEGATDYLEDFKHHFRRRFAQKQVPVLEVMDQEFGVGLKGPVAQQNSDYSGLLDDLVSFGKPKEKISEPSKKTVSIWPSNTKDTKLFHDLTSSDVSKLNIYNGEWSDQMFAICSLIGDQEMPDIYIQHAAQGNPAFLIARFGYLPDDGIESLIKDCISDELSGEKDKLFADIIHLPESRTGNILQRPSCYPYEIPFLARSVLPKDKQIELRDVMVSVDNDRVILTHNRSKKEIIPKLNNAHNYSNGQLAIYEFLVRCGKQKESGVYKIDEYSQTQFGFTPGLRFDKLIFSLPKWKIHLSELKKLIPADQEERTTFLYNWSKENNMPDAVILKEGDRHLFVNWQNQNLVECCWQVLKNKNTAHFEYYPYATGSPVKENGLSLANQFIICFHQTK